MVLVLRLLWLAMALAAAQAAPAFEPFFDDNPATRHAPQAPRLTELDIDVLILCGEWGAPVAAADFQAMLLDPAHRGALGRIREALGDRVFSRAGSDTDFVAQLRRAWFEQKGFKHVFCGEPGVGRDLGGLHYAPRYWQAQDEGWAGYRKLLSDHRDRPVGKCREHYLRERIEPPVFNISISFLNPSDAGNNVKCLGGYHYQMDAERMLIAATAAFKQANRRTGPNESAACFFETRLDGVEAHVNNLVIRSRAIRTFYPLADKRPYCRRDRRDWRACLCARL